MVCKPHKHWAGAAITRFIFGGVVMAKKSDGEVMVGDGENQEIER